MKKIFYIIITVIVIIVLVLFCGCTKNNIPTDKNDTQTGNQELTQIDIKQEIDYYELKDNSVLQYPASNELFTYNVYEDTIYDYGNYIEITGYNGTEGQALKSVDIPEEIEGCKVICVTGFSKYRNMTNLSLPDSLLCIEEYAFNDCGLTTLILPDNVQYIEKFAFWGNNLTKLACSKSLKSIDCEAFENNFLETIELNDSLIEIGEKAFAFSYNLKAIDRLVIPKSVERIGYEAFCNVVFNEIVVESKNVIISDSAFNLYNKKDTEIKSTFYGYAGSSTAQYCVDNGLKFQIIE